MTTPRRRSPLTRFLRRLVLLDAAIFGIAGVVCWVGGWRTWIDYSNGLFIGCAAVLGIAIISAYGGWMTTSGFNYQYSSTASHDDAHHHAQRALRDRNEGLRAIVQAAVVCALPLITAALIQGMLWPV